MAAGLTFSVGRFADGTGVILDVSGMQLQVKNDGLYYVDATGSPTAIWGMRP